jgi:hypothetical protein
VKIFSTFFLNEKPYIWRRMILFHFCLYAWASILIVHYHVEFKKSAIKQQQEAPLRFAQYDPLPVLHDHCFVTHRDAPSIIASWSGKTFFFCSPDGGQIRVDLKTGNVTIIGMKPDNASRVFWESLERARLIEPPAGYVGKDGDPKKPKDTK